jgi:hypothetical protein
VWASSSLRSLDVPDGTPQPQALGVMLGTLRTLFSISVLGLLVRAIVASLYEIYPMNIVSPTLHFGIVAFLLWAFLVKPNWKGSYSIMWSYVISFSVIFISFSQSSSGAYGKYAGVMHFLDYGIAAVCILIMPTLLSKDARRYFSSAAT